MDSMFSKPHRGPALVAALALALSGCRSATPARDAVPSPGSAPGSPAPLSPTNAALPDQAGDLTGRLLVLTPSEPGAPPTLTALDMATGQSTTLWPVFEPAEAGFSAHDWAIAPDGRRIAYLRKGGSGEGRIVLRDLAPGAPRRDFPVGGGTADVLLWLPDGSGLVYGALVVAENGEDLAKVQRWSLRRLDLASGEDVELMALDEAALAGKFPRLAGFDPASGHAAVLTGPGENFYVDGIRHLDTATGQTIRTINARDEGFQAVASPDGGLVAYGDCQGCQQGAGGVVKLLVLEGGGVFDAADLDLGGKVVGLRWSPDGRSIAWTAYDQGHPRPDDNHSLGVARRRPNDLEVLALPEPAGSAVAFSPDGSQLLGTGGVYDLATGTRSDPPWPLPEGLSWSEAPWRVLGWVPDATP
jgi:dipeptidyl aminopeptidase/acylaminoacyl peptidase